MKVPKDLAPTGNVALLIAECPEPRFDEVMRVRITGRKTRVRVDPLFVAVCEEGTIQCCGCVPDFVSPVGARMLYQPGHDAVGVEITIGLGSWLWLLMCGRKERMVVVRLTAIRKGFGGMRFPWRSDKQRKQNDAFIDSAYTKEDFSELEASWKAREQ